MENDNENDQGGFNRWIERLKDAIKVSNTIYV